MPTSKETRVRLEGFWKTIASVLPRRGRYGMRDLWSVFDPGRLVEDQLRLYRAELGQGEAVAPREGGGGWRGVF